jgi:hypothetical protein
MRLLIASFVILAAASCQSSSAGVSDGGASDGPERDAPALDSRGADSGPTRDTTGDLPAGSSACGPRGGGCAGGAAACGYCDSAGNPWQCTCSGGKWECALGDGTCGVTCGERRCLPDELCQELDEGQGVPTDGGAGHIEHLCRPTPAGCIAGQPTCACAASSIPRCGQADVCACTDTTAPRTLRCTCQNP